MNDRPTLQETKREEENDRLRAAANDVCNSIYTVHKSESVNLGVINVTQAHFNALAQALGRPERIE